jgi:hypothetical protein
VQASARASLASGRVRRVFEAFSTMTTVGARAGKAAAPGGGGPDRKLGTTMDFNQERPEIVDNEKKEQGILI